ncbi:MAG: FtsX-like permease family protein [Methanomassiliicoccales archaeon PtaU1.Bin124]|nr:MAG: FtsX-like permease family protein [Methanomassiliicoccales archaeon PtaU1.Bin124]
MSIRTGWRVPAAVGLIGAGLVCTFLRLVLFAAVLFLIAILALVLLQPSYLNRQAWKEVKRHGRSTLLIMLGVAVVTAGVGTALLVNDSLVDFVDRSGRAALGPVDIAVTNASRDDSRFYNTSELQGVLSQLSSSIGPSYPAAFVSAPAVGGNLVGFSPDVQLISMYGDAVEHFGGFTTYSGGHFDREMEGDEVLVNRAFTETIPVTVDNYVFIHYGNITVPLHVIGIVKEVGIGELSASAATIFCSSTVTNLVSESHWGFNRILIDADGNDVHASSERTGQVLNATFSTLGLGVYDNSAIEMAKAHDDYAVPLTALGSVGGFSMMAGIFIVVGFITVAQQGRDRDARVFRSLGLKRGEIAAMRATECIVCALPGVTIGLAASTLFLLFLIGGDGAPSGYIFNVGLVLRPTTLALTGLSVLGCTLMAALAVSLLPIKKGSGRKIADGIIIAALLIVLAITSIGLAAGWNELTFPSLAVLLLITGMVRWLRASSLYWTSASFVLIIVLVIGVRDGWMDTGLPTLLALAGVLLVCLGMAASLLLERSAAGALWVLQQLKGCTASRYLSIKHLRQDRSRRTIIVLSIAALFLITSLSSSMLAMARTNIDAQFQEGAASIDAVVLRPDLGQTDADVWKMVNDTNGVLWSANISAVTPIYAGLQRILIDPVGNITSGGMKYYVVGMDRSLIGTFGLGLTNYDHANFTSEEEVWNAVSTNTTLAIVDSEMVNSYSDLLHPGEKAGIGSKVRIMNETGGASDVTIVGITRQRFLLAVFVGSGLVSSAMNVTHPTIIAIDYKDGLDAMVQSDMLRSVVFPADLMVIDIGSTKAWVDRSITEWTRMFDSLLIATSFSLTAGLVAQMLHVSQLRERETGLLRSLGMRKRQRQGTMLRELAIPSLAGLVVGLVSANVLYYVSWMTILKQSGLRYQGWGIDVVLWDAVILAVILITAYLAMGLFQSQEREPAE